MSLIGKTIVLGVTGGIAVFKACELVSSLKKKGAKIHVIMTKAACEFVTPLTFEVLSGNRVVTDMFDRDFSWDVEHISLAKAADIFAVVPATANFLGKMANGIADDMLTTTVMATRAPVVIAPAMNTAMYENIAVQQNINTLKQRGVHFIEPESGLLACGDVGKGKLATVAMIENEIIKVSKIHDLTGLSVLVTAGPTREPLDPVRFISNHSTGKMGYEIAENAMMRGANVTIISGPVSLDTPFGVNRINVSSALDMREAVIHNMPNYDIIIKAAAVGDYRPINTADDKIKKDASSDKMSIELTQNPDILKEVCSLKSNKQVICGFSMETRDLIENSTKKLEKKGCHMMVANNLKVEGAGFGTDTNIVTILYRDKQPEKLEIMSKADVADEILTRLLNIYKCLND